MIETAQSENWSADFNLPRVIGSIVLDGFFLAQA